MIPYKTLEEIELVRESAQLVSKTLGELKNYIVPGALPIDLDKIAETFIKDNKAIPGFLGLYGFPNSLCISINEEVVHGIPGNKPLQNGDIISIDCGVLKNNYYGDHAYTYEVGKVSNEIKKLTNSIFLSIRIFCHPKEKRLRLKQSLLIGTLSKVAGFSF